MSPPEDHLASGGMQLDILQSISRLLENIYVSASRGSKKKTTMKGGPRVTPSPQNNALKTTLQMGMLYAMCIVQNGHNARCPEIDGWASFSIVHSSSLFSKNACIPKLQYTIH